MARRLNLRVDQGASWSQNVVVYEANSTGTFAANLYHWANGAGQIRKAYASANAAANITVSVHGSNTEGILTLSMNSATTGAITAGRYLYDVELRGGAVLAGYSSGDEENKTLRTHEGQITITPQITQWDW